MTELQFLNETINHYNSTNRALDEFGQCIYSSTDTSEGCAIGRWLDKNTCDMYDTKGQISIDTIYEKNVTCLPEWMQKMDIKFLSSVQFLHDTESFWNENGLSKEGRQLVEKIKAKFEL